MELAGGNVRLYYYIQRYILHDGYPENIISFIRRGSKQ